MSLVKGATVSNNNVYDQLGPLLDAFSRVRISSPETILDSKQLHDKQPLIYDEVVGGGATSVYSIADSSTKMNVFNNGDYVIRQTKQRPNYQPGKSPLIEMTFTFEEPKVGITQRVGSFNTSIVAPYTADIDGIYLESIDLDVSICIAKNGVVRKTPVDYWKTLNTANLRLDKSQILVINYQYLGVGDVDVGFYINGRYTPLVSIPHANDSAGVYMGTPNHSLRYEIRSTGSAGTLEHICSTVISEGGSDITGIERAVDTGITQINLLTAGVFYPIVGIRLKDNCLDSTIDFLSTSVVVTSNQNLLYRVLLNPTITGTLTYSDEIDSCVQTTIGNGSQTVTGGTVIRSGYISSQGRESTTNVKSSLRIGSNIDGTRDQMILCATPFSANTKVDASMGWVEAL